MVNKKEILIFTILCTFNFLFYNNAILGSVLAILEIVLVIFHLIITGSIKKTFYWHMLFMLSSLENFIDAANYNTIIYSYKHFELPFLPISLSTLITIFLFTLSVVKNKKLFIGKSDNAYRFILFFFLLPFITGVMGLLVRDYEIWNYIRAAMMPFISLCTYTLMFEQKSEHDIEKFKSLLVSVLVGSVLASYVGAILGIQASYGAAGLTTFPMNQIMLFSPFLLSLSLYYTGSKRRFLFLVGALACLNILAFNASGKGIIFVVIASGTLLYKMATNHKRIVGFIFTILLFALSTLLMFNFSPNMFADKNLFNSKFNQVVSFLTITDWGTDLQNLPKSPRVRLIETIDISLSLKENVVDLIVGRGFGGYFEDKTNLFYNINLYDGAFSIEEILSGKFERPHESWNEIFLLTGLMGIIAWIRILIMLFKDTIKDNTKSIYKLIAFLFVALMWNTYAVLSYFGLICMYVSQYGLVSDGANTITSVKENSRPENWE